MLGYLPWLTYFKDKQQKPIFSNIPFKLNNTLPHIFLIYQIVLNDR